MTALIPVLMLAQTPDYKAIVQPAFKDAKFVAKIISGNQKELKKINSDFAQSYRFTTTTAYVKEPFMLRVEAEVEDTKLMYIVNGGKKYYRIGSKMGYTQDVSKAPGKRQTIFDFGMLTPSLFTSGFMEAKYIRKDDSDLVFDITFDRKLDNSRHRVWVDSSKKYITKRTWYDQAGRLMATFEYSNPKNEDGVWFPTKCVVKNNENKVAGTTEYQKMAINTGLDSALFKF
jgi:outer membrane lipoprotein-sorting protein